jgi:hypothetical protein
MGSKRQDALEDLRDRLSQITTDNGFASNAGALIFVGEVPRIGPDDEPAAICVVVGPDQPSTTGSRTICRVPIEIQAIVPADLADPMVALEGILGDVKRAVEIEGVEAYRSRGLNGTLPVGLERASTRWLPRQEGDAFVGAGVGYVAIFDESWGQP